MLQLHAVQKSYGSARILTIPSLQLQNGIYWVKGENGSGKTTFLKMTAALLPFEGDIIFNGTSLKKEPVAYRRQISWAEAEPQYPPYLRGKDLVDLYCSLRKVSFSAADTIIGLFKMQDYLNHAIGSYSSGMMKKLSLALAFIGDASLLVLDEPLITLDQEALQVVTRLILHQQRTGNQLVLMSSHQDPGKDLLLENKVLSVHNQSISF